MLAHTAELAQIETLPSIRDTLYNFERPQRAFDYDMAQQVGLRQAANGNQALGGNKQTKLMKLIENSGADADELAKNLVSAERAQSSTNAQEDNLINGSGAGGGQQQQQPAISISTRSMQSSRSNSLNLPKAYISSLLYGRQGASSMPHYGTFNKKAEPKENFFMHFGRK